MAPLSRLPFAEKLLSYDAILIHLDHTKPNLAHSGETVVDVLIRAAALIGQGSVGSVSRIRRVVLAVGDVGRLRLDEGTVVPLKDMSSAALFGMSYDPVVRSWPALIAALANLASTIELSAEDGRRCPFLFVPYDFFGDIAGHECLNRDPINGERDLLTMGGVIDVRASEDPLWRPFNLADVIFATTTQGVQSNSIFLVEE